MKNKSRVSTTISQKHFAILEKHAKEQGAQQKVLELALEAFDNNTLQDPPLSLEESFILNTWRGKLSCVVYRELFNNLVRSTDLKLAEDWYKENKMCMAFALEFFYQRPFKDLSLREILDGLVATAKISNWFNEYTYSDDGDHYTLKVYHDCGITGSKYILLMFENIFNFSELKYKSSISEKSLFVKVYKSELDKKGVPEAYRAS